MLSVKNPLISFLLSIGVLSVDQISKFFARQWGLAELNTGFSFSIFSGQSIILHLIFFILVEVMLWQLISQDRKRLFSWFIIISVSGFSNLLDRAVWGGVIDFLPVPILQVKNNFADWFIFFGVMSILWVQMKKSDAKKN